MHLLVFSHHGGGGKSCVSRLSCVFPGGTFSLVFAQSNLTPPASVRAARNLSASVKRQASRTNFMAPFGDGYRQHGEEVPESELTRLLSFLTKCHFSGRLCAKQSS